jgi:hypothetical protein
LLNLDNRRVPGAISLVAVTNGGDKRYPELVADLAEHGLEETAVAVFAVTGTD